MQENIINMNGATMGHLPKIQIDFDIDNCGAVKMAIKVAKCFVRIRNDFDEYLADKFSPLEANE